MPARLNHTIVWCRDRQSSARLLTEVLGLPPPRRFMQFLVVDLANEVSFDDPDGHLFEIITAPYDDPATL